MEQLSDKKTCTFFKIQRKNSDFSGAEENILFKGKFSSKCPLFMVTNFWEFVGLQVTDSKFLLHTHGVCSLKLDAQLQKQFK